MKTLHLFMLVCLISFNTMADSGRIAAGRLQVYYQRSGHGPAVLFLHGGYLDLHQWDRETALLKRTHTVIRIDLPGHALTTGKDSSIHIAEVIRIVLDSLHIHKTTVVGLSLGGSCALDFALAHPERMDKLVLVAAGLSGWPQVMKLDPLSEHLFNVSDSAFLSKDHARITETFTRLWCDGPYRKPDQVSPAARRYVKKTVDQNDADESRTWPVFDPDKAAPRAKNVVCPTLIFAGDKDVPFILTVAKYLHSQIKSSRLVIVKGSAHMINLEKPLLFGQTLKNFLALRHGTKNEKFGA